MKTVGQNQAEMLSIAGELANTPGPKQAYWREQLLKLSAAGPVIDSGYVGTTKDGRQIYVVRNAMKTSWLVHAGKDAQLCGAVTILNMFPITQHNAAVDWASEQVSA
jgi:hypothetical protein